MRMECLSDDWRVGWCLHPFSSDCRGLQRVSVSAVPASSFCSDLCGEFAWQSAIRLEQERMLLSFQQVKAPLWRVMLMALQYALHPLPLDLEILVMGYVDGLFGHLAQLDGSDA